MRRELATVSLINEGLSVRDTETRPSEAIDRAVQFCDTHPDRRKQVIDALLNPDIPSSLLPAVLTDIQVQVVEEAQKSSLQFNSRHFSEITTDVIG